MFSKACEYGIRSLIFITAKSNNGERVNLTDISKEIDSPPAFTAKVLQKLVKGSIIKSVKGPKGGFCISESTIETATLADVVILIDGDEIFTGCGLGLKVCNALKPCPLHYKFKSIRDDLKQMLQKTKLKDLAEQLENGNALLKL